jgi:hypothetical protein
LALPDGKPGIVSVGELPGVMPKSWVLPPDMAAAGKTASSKQSASAGALTNNKDSDAPSVDSPLSVSGGTCPPPFVPPDRASKFPQAPSVSPAMDNAATTMNVERTRI